MIDITPGTRLLRALPIALSLLAGHPADAAGIGDAAAVPHLNQRGQEGYRQFLAADLHRAFAIAPGGGWGWSMDAPSRAAAQAQAVATCQQHSRYPCIPYALDREVVFDAAEWSRQWRPYATAAEARRATLGTGRGHRFPDLVLTAPDGKATKLSDLRGKVVVLHFWATWCPTCRHELPQFQRLQQRFSRERDIAFVFTQVREPADTARAWLKRQGIELALHDSSARSSRDDTFPLAGGGSVKDRLVARVFPTTYVLDRHGLVVFSLRGSAEDWDEYVPFLKDLLAHRK